MYYRVIRCTVTPKDNLFPWCRTITQKANNLRNATLFRMRQVLTATNKPEAEWTDNEREIMDEIAHALPAMGDRYAMPAKGKCFLSYGFLDSLFKVTGNPDYAAEGLPKQTAQQTVRATVKEMKSFFSLAKDFRGHPEKYKGKPELPKYGRKGGMHTAVVTNQGCAFMEKTDRRGRTSLYARMPYAKKEELYLNIGAPVPGIRLKQATVRPTNTGMFEINFTFECGEELPALSHKPERILAVDLGVNNLMAAVNNCGLPSLLYKGGVVKCLNQQYNKEAARIMSEEMGRPDCPENKKGDPKFVPTEEFYHITERRMRRMDDSMHKYAKHLITWCVGNRIDTIVVGVLKDWKQGSDIGHVNNQNFVQIPFSRLRWNLRYLAERAGIRYIEQDESYTSLASFPDGDECREGAAFSGKRRPARYKGMYKKGGFRGLYRTADGSIINSDLNAAANILKKAFPDAFRSCPPDFGRVEIIRHPDLQNRADNRATQLAENTASPRPVCSRSKLKRLRRKCAAQKSNPTGITGLYG